MTNSHSKKGRRSRIKGQEGEREVGKILSEELGFPIKRILDQTREGGHDISIPGFAVEVKRCEQISLGKWIRQARKSVANTDLNWAVCYRHNRGNWVVVLETDIEGLATLSRETMKTKRIPDYRWETLSGWRSGQSPDKEGD